MATRSRIYKSTDWQIWTYVPTPGVLRLDFSKWNDGSKWGSTPGSIEPIDLPISEISITEDFSPSLGLTQMNSGTANFSFEVQTFDKSVLAEFYTGKPIYITLKNEETTRLDPTFGQNTIIFSGYISSASFEYNKFNVVQTLNVTATDSMQYLLNSLLSVTKTIGAFDSKTENLQTAFFTTTTKDTRPIYCLRDGGSPFNFSGLPPANISGKYEKAGVEVNSWGYWVQDLINTYAGNYIVGYPYIFVNVGSNQVETFKRFQFSGLSDVNSFSSYATMQLDKVVSVSVGNSFPDKPSVFEISNNSGLNYSFGQSVANSTNQVISYNQVVDSPQTDLEPMVVANLSFRNWISPIEVTIELAREYQTIVFDDKQGLKYLFPQNYAQCSDAIFLDLTSNGFESADSYLYITGRTITVTKDNALITYQTKRTE